MEEDLYESKSPLTVLAKYDEQMLRFGDNPFSLPPTPEDVSAEWCERDPSVHYFFVEINTDISMDVMSVEEYQAWVEAKREAERLETLFEDRGDVPSA